MFFCSNGRAIFFAAGFAGLNIEATNANNC